MKPDRETVRVSKSPIFQRIVAAAQRNYEKHGRISLEEVRRRLYLEPVSKHPRKK